MALSLPSKRIQPMARSARLVDDTSAAADAQARSGCAAPYDYTGRFIRYHTLQDGARVAIVTPDQPQWMPTAAVVGRVGD